MIRLLIYDPLKGLTESHDPYQIRPWENKDQLVWADISFPTEEDLEVLRRVFRFHPLAIEDCIHFRQRPKLDEYWEYCFLVLHWTRLEHKTKLVVNELNLFLGPNFIVTYSQTIPGFINDIWNHYRQDEKLLAQGVDLVFHAVADALIDGFFPVFEHLEEELERLEELVFIRPSRALLSRLFVLRRQLLKLKRILAPEREVLASVLREDFPYIRENRRAYFMDVYDHVLRLLDLAESYRDLADTALEAYMSVTSNRLNEVIKILTIITTIMMPLSVIAGIYGMNFRYMPELEWRYGYFFVLGIMALVAGGMMYYFRKKNWL